MFNIMTLNKIAPCGLEKFSTHYTFTDDATANADGVLLRSYKMHDMKFPADLKGIARAGAGVNNIPIDKCSQKGIVVFNTPGANANAVKELIIGCMFVAARNIVRGVNWANTLKDSTEDIAKAVEKGKAAFVGYELEGKKMGVIGMGAIGARVANTAHDLGMEVIGHDPFLSVDSALRISRAVKVTSDIKEIFETCDFITLHLPLNESTRNKINRETFGIMKDGAVILNFSRGELVDNVAMKEALDYGKIACYVCDFPSKETLDMKHVINTPHLGASTSESEDNCAKMAAKEMIDFLENGNITNSVNFPECHMPWESKKRITIAHKNIPSMLSQFSAAFAEFNVNIINMLNKSKCDYAYTMIDLDSDVDEVITNKLSSIDGVLRVRMIEK